MLKTVICCLFGEGANLFTLCAWLYLDPGNRTRSSAKRTGKDLISRTFRCGRGEKGQKSAGEQEGVRWSRVPGRGQSVGWAVWGEFGRVTSVH